MNHYAYIPRADGSEPTGSANRVIFKDQFKTLKGVIRRCKYRMNWDTKPFEIYTFEEFFDDSSFKLVYKNKV